MHRTLLLALFLFLVRVNAQERPIKIEEKKIPNRLALYAVNENEYDLDVLITVSGTNFRQSKARPRLIRVPATSKVHMKTLMLMRGKQPSYTYDLVVNDSLSKRALKKEYELIKIRPKKQITVYVPENCKGCDSIIYPLSQGKYIFSAYNLEEKPEMYSQLQSSLGQNFPLDSITEPIINLGGRLHTKIGTYEQLLEELNKE